MTSVQIEYAKTAFEIWNDIIAVDMVYEENKSSADIVFNYTDSFLVNNAVEKKSVINGAIIDSDIWIKDKTATSDAVLREGEAFSTLFLHEIGHSLGLNHPSGYDGNDSNFLDSANFVQDTVLYSVMSYFEHDDNINQYNGDFSANHIFNGRTQYSQTPTIYDIQAAQTLYGANAETRTGDTVYGFNSTEGGTVFDFDYYGEFRMPVFSIWDAGGEDTIDASNYSQNQFINLLPGSASNIGGLDKNIWIALPADDEKGKLIESLIENAVGGSGNDTIVGNSADNKIDGGFGIDTVVYDGYFENYNIRFLPNGNIYVYGPDDGKDTLVGVEYLHFKEELVSVGDLLSNERASWGQIFDQIPDEKVSNGNTFWGDGEAAEEGEDVLDLDVYVSGEATGADGLFVNDGSGNFAYEPVPGGGLDNQASAVAGDLDGDGDLDIVLSRIEFETSPVFMINDGSGTFTEVQVESQTGRQYSQYLDVALGDLDGDNKLDIYFVGFGEDIVLINQGDGVFSSTFSISGSESLAGNTGVALGDLDDDGDLDAFVTNSSPTSTSNVLINDGNGNFLASNASDSAAWAGDVSLAYIDVDGDLDAVISHNRSPNEILINDGAGNFFASDLPGYVSFTSDIALGDLDSDGDVDVFVLNDGASNQILINDGSGNFVALDAPTSAEIEFSVALGDLDGDGDLDAYVGCYGADQLLLNDGSGNFVVVEVSGQLDSTGVVIGDFDGDGTLPAVGDNLLPYFGDETIA